ncbi:unnamed protein product [Acanthoscelides obtectus]|uniref:SCAN domain-containing protein 3 n=1 Tax=Acanthoscelides obtectus TaxID=200917 RepID=A0A9P0M2C4_ACAOB|nr:unnamed protein product [Acanthoscelides obtectus]CAK1664136.1 Zinc finger BED domain-containing protein 5 [Acanthoscelides obtectus]
MKPSKLHHLRRCHPDKTEKDLKYFQTLKDKFQKRPTLDRMFASTSQRNDDGLRASYNISLLIAKSGKPHTIGEKLILPAVEEVLKTVLHKPASDIIKRISLSNNTVERRIDEMSSDIESFLCNYLQTTHFSIQLDESTLPDNAALLLAYVRFIMNQEIYARTLITDTKDFESRFEDILTMVIPPWMINPYGDIEETNVIIQEELTELSTNEELEVQFKNGYHQFWLQNNIPVTYPKITEFREQLVLSLLNYDFTNLPESRPQQTSIASKRHHAISKKIGAFNKVKKYCRSCYAKKVQQKIPKSWMKKVVTYCIT